MYCTNNNHVYRNTNTLSDFRLITLSTSAGAGVYLGEFCSVEIQASYQVAAQAIAGRVFAV